MVNVDRMLRGITARQFAELLAYKEIELFRELRADYRIASVVQVLLNVNRPKGRKPYTLEEARVKFEKAPPKRKQTWQEQLAILKLFAGIHNASPEARRD